VSDLVILTGSVDAATNPQMIGILLDNGTLSTAIAFKGADTGYAVWAPTFNSGVNWFSSAGGGMYLGLESSNGQVSGTITMNEAIDVPVVVVLSGRNGQVGKQALDPGQTSVSFSFPVSQSDAFTTIDVAENIRGFLDGTFP